MKLALRITSKGEVTELDLTSKELPTLQEAVGGLIEAINLATDLTMFCNEEGKLLDLPHNPFAQYLWDKRFGAHLDYIVGDIVLTGGADDEGEMLGLSDEQVQIIKQMTKQVQQIIAPSMNVLEWTA